MKHHRFVGSCVAVVLVTSCAVSGEELRELIDAPVQKVVGDCAFTEGPAWHPDGYLLFSDIPNSRILRVDADGSSREWLNSSGGANGLVCDQQGNVYACQGAAGRIVRLRTREDGTGELAAVVADAFEGQPFIQPNDLALDTSGGLYFTDPDYRQDPESTPQPVQGVYCVAANGTVRCVIDNLPRPNGVLVTADGRALYVANIELRQIMKYEITGPGELGPAEVLFEGDAERDGRGPDGMALDERGNIYATYKSVVVVSPRGELIGRLEVPEKPSNCTFGGKDGRTLYITAQTSLYSVQANVAGAPLPASGPEGKPPESRTVTARDLKLQIPGEWKQEEPANRLRLAQFVIPAVEGDADPGELVVSGPFGGSNEANIARWIQQFEADGRSVKMTQGRGAQGTYIVVELAGIYKRPVGPPVQGRTEPAPGYRMLGAIINLGDKGNYFLKLTGPDKTVSAAGDAFRSSFGGSSESETPYELSQ